VTGYEKIAAAFSAEGTPECPAVSCYLGIFERDHFARLTDLPWWYLHERDTERRARVCESLSTAVDFDWFDLPGGFTREDQQHIRTAERAGGIFLCDDRTGAARLLQPPVTSGALHVQSDMAPTFADVEDYLQERVPRQPAFAGLLPEEADLPERLLSTLGKTKFPIRHVGSPLWVSASLLGYEQWFSVLGTEADSLYAGCRRILHNVLREVKCAAAQGCRAIFIEECLTDQIGPTLYHRYNHPLLRELTEAIRVAGMVSILYFCGNPWPVWPLLMDSGADALSFEESKKGFAIDIEDVVERVNGKKVVLGNLDVIEILEQGNRAQLDREIQRQLAAGRRNGCRFIMNTGSPITPGTSVARAREYVELVRRHGRY
jgi:hypothetical protein